MSTYQLTLFGKMNQNEGDMFLHRIGKLTEQVCRDPQKKETQKKRKFLRVELAFFTGGLWLAWGLYHV